MNDKRAINSNNLKIHPLFNANFDFTKDLTANDDE